MSARLRSRPWFAYGTYRWPYERQPVFVEYLGGAFDAVLVNIGAREHFMFPRETWDRSIGARLGQQELIARAS